MKKFISLREAENIYGISFSTLKRFTLDEKFPAINTGRKWMIEDSKFEAYLKEITREYRLQKKL